MSTIKKYSDNYFTNSPTRKTLGFVMMIDVSGSMSTWIDIVKIDAKAFVRCAEPGDQFGVNQFSNNASWIYPEGSNPNIVTISSNEDTKKAIEKIELIKSLNLTNIGDAIRLGNNMIAKATTDIKAFVLLSDGEYNTGAKPETVLENTPPIYIAGLGAYLKKEYFKGVLSKNASSKYYSIPNVVDMMLMFNQIIADSSESSLVLNNKNELKSRPGCDYILEKFNISNKDRLVRVSVVWSDKKFQYTSGKFENYLMNVILIDPDNKTTTIKPNINDPGYCTFNLESAKLGEWKVLIQYNTSEPFVCTVGAIELNSAIKSNVDIPVFSKLDEEIPLKVWVTDDAGVNISDLTIYSRISKPVKTLEYCVAKYRNEFEQIDLPENIKSENEEAYKFKMLRELKLNDSGIDIFERNNSNQILLKNNEGVYSGLIGDTSVGGIYNIDFQIEGINPKTGIKFTTIKTHSVFVG